MAYVITEMCTRNGDCAETCPVEAISFVEGNADWPTYYINPDLCIECGACAGVCESEAIFYEDDVPAEYEAAIAKNAEFFASGPGA